MGEDDPWGNSASDGWGNSPAKGSKPDDGWSGSSSNNQNNDSWGSSSRDDNRRGRGRGSSRGGYGDNQRFGARGNSSGGNYGGGSSGGGWGDSSTSNSNNTDDRRGYPASGGNRPPRGRGGGGPSSGGYGGSSGRGSGWGSSTTSNDNNIDDAWGSSNNNNPDDAWGSNSKSDDAWGNPPPSDNRRPGGRGASSGGGFGSSSGDGWGNSSSSNNTKNSDDAWGNPPPSDNRRPRGRGGSSSGGYGGPSGNQSSGGGWADSSNNDDKPEDSWGNSADSDNRRPGGRGNSTGSGWGDSGKSNNMSHHGNAEGMDPEERPAPYRPEELNLDEEAKIQADTVGENFQRYQDQTVTCLPPNLITPIEKFSDVIESKLLLDNLKRLKFDKMTPIQKWAMPAITEGYDLIGCAQTGSGKTAAFLLPILQSIMKLGTSQDDPNDDCRHPYCLIVSPTRELTRQIYSNAELLSKDSIVKSCFLYGQVATAHLKAQLMRGCHILVSTVGRLKDFVQRGWISFKNIKFIVLDEGDRLIEDGFSEDIKSILEHETMPPKEERQLLFFSATFKSDQQKSAKEYLRQKYAFITVGRVGAANEDITQEFVEVTRPEKKAALKKILDEIPETDRAIVFTQTKQSADILASYFTSLNLSSTSIHGDRHQSQREQAISSFRKGERRFLISSPVGNRGLDLPKVALVINYDLPENIDEYVHRIGRTGRAGHTGRAISFFVKERDQEILPALIQILKDAKQEIPSFMTDSAIEPTADSGEDWNTTAAAGDSEDWGEVSGSAAHTSAQTNTEEDWGASADSALKDSIDNTAKPVNNSQGDDWGNASVSSNRSTIYKWQENPGQGDDGQESARGEKRPNTEDSENPRKKTEPPVNRPPSPEPSDSAW